MTPPPPLRNFQNFCTYKKESQSQLSYVNMVEFYYNSVNINVIKIIYSAFYPAKLLGSLPSTLQRMFVLFYVRLYIKLKHLGCSGLFHVFEGCPIHTN